MKTIVPKEIATATIFRKNRHTLTILQGSNNICGWGSSLSGSYIESGYATHTDPYEDYVYLKALTNGTYWVNGNVMEATAGQEIAHTYNENGKYDGSLIAFIF